MSKVIFLIHGLKIRPRQKDEQDFLGQNNLIQSFIFASPTLWTPLLTAGCEMKALTAFTKNPDWSKY